MFSYLSSGMWFGLKYTNVVMNYDPLAQRGILSLYRDAHLKAESGSVTEKQKHKTQRRADWPEKSKVKSVCSDPVT